MNVYGNNFDSGAITCAADLGIRADIRGFKAPGMTEVIDTDSRLPSLPTYFVNLYRAERVGAANDRVIREFSRLIESACTLEREKDINRAPEKKPNITPILSAAIRNGPQLWKNHS